MFNYMANQLVKNTANAFLKKYEVYEPDKTAVIFINAQNAFLSNEPVLNKKYKLLLEHARVNKFKVIHSTQSTKPSKQPTRAQQYIVNKLNVTESSKNIPEY